MSKNSEKLPDEFIIDDVLYGRVEAINGDWVNNKDQDYNAGLYVAHGNSQSGYQDSKLLHKVYHLPIAIYPEPNGLLEASMAMRMAGDYSLEALLGLSDADNLIPNKSIFMFSGITGHAERSPRKVKKNLKEGKKLRQKAFFTTASYALIELSNR